MNYPSTMGFWITPKVWVSEQHTWSDFADTLLRLRDHARKHGAAGDLTLHAPFGGGRSSDTTLPDWFRAAVAGRCLGGSPGSGGASTGAVAQHPEMPRWQSILDPRGIGDIDAFIQAMKRAHDGGWATISVYIGSFRYLPDPQLMSVWPFIKSEAPIRRIIFDQSPPLRGIDRQFLEKLGGEKAPLKDRSPNVRIGLEILRKDERYPIPLDICGTLAHLKRHADDPKSTKLVPGGKRTRTLCMDLKEVKKAKKRGWRPLLYVKERDMPDVFA